MSNKINYYSSLLKKIKKKKSIVSVIGQGYVGFPLSDEVSKSGFKTIGLDTDKSKIKNLKNKNKNIFFTSNYRDLSNVDIIIFALPTPIKNFLPDLSYIDNSLKQIVNFLKKGSLIILESTSYPGSTNEKIIKVLNKKFTIGKNLFVGYSPERVDPGNKRFNIYNIPKICSGYSSSCLNLTEKFYKSFCKKTIRASSLENAEMAKLFENIFRFVNIGLVNELKQISKVFKIDIHEVINLASSKPFGFMKFEPGPGIGGHCIPVDPFYFSWKAKQKKKIAKFINVAAKINSEMPNFIYQNIINILKLKSKKIKNLELMFLGISYKKDVDDLRNSPAFEIFKKFYKKRFRVCYNDHYIKSIIINHKNIKSVNLNNLGKFDFCILLVDHSYFKKINFSNFKGKIIDTRNFFKGKKVLKI